MSQTETIGVILRPKVVKDFAVGTAGVADWRLVQATTAAPPVFTVVVKENTFTRVNTAGVAIRLAANFDNFGFNALFFKHFLPDICGFIVTRNPVGDVTDKSRDVNFVGVQADFISQEFKKPADLLFFEIVS